MMDNETDINITAKTATEAVVTSDKIRKAASTYREAVEKNLKHAKSIDQALNSLLQALNLAGADLDTVAQRLPGIEKAYASHKGKITKAINTGAGKVNMGTVKNPSYMHIADAISMSAIETAIRVGLKHAVYSAKPEDVEKYVREFVEEALKSMPDPTPVDQQMVSKLIEVLTELSSNYVEAAKETKKVVKKAAAVAGAAATKTTTVKENIDAAVKDAVSVAEKASVSVEAIIAKVKEIDEQLEAAKEEVKSLNFEKDDILARYPIGTKQADMDEMDIADIADIERELRDNLKKIQQLSTQKEKLNSTKPAETVEENPIKKLKSQKAMLQEGVAEAEAGLKQVKEKGESKQGGHSSAPRRLSEEDQGFIRQFWADLMGEFDEAISGFIDAVRQLGDDMIPVFKQEIAYMMNVVGESTRKTISSSLKKVAEQIEGIFGTTKGVGDLSGAAASLTRIDQNIAGIYEALVGKKYIKANRKQSTPSGPEPMDLNTLYAWDSLPEEFRGFHNDVLGILKEDFMEGGNIATPEGKGWKDYISYEGGLLSAPAKALTKIQGFRDGGFLPGGKPAWVGEAGPELLLPNGSGFDVVSNSGVRALAGGTLDPFVGTNTFYSQKKSFNWNKPAAAGNSTTIFGGKALNILKELGIEYVPPEEEIIDLTIDDPAPDDFIPYQFADRLKSEIQSYFTDLMVKGVAMEHLTWLDHDDSTPAFDRFGGFKYPGTDIGKKWISAYRNFKNTVVPKFPKYVADFYDGYIHNDYDEQIARIRAGDPATIAARNGLLKSVQNNIVSDYVGMPLFRGISSERVNVLIEDTPLGGILPGKENFESFSTDMTTASYFSSGYDSRSILQTIYPEGVPFSFGIPHETEMMMPYGREYQILAKSLIPDWQEKGERGAYTVVSVLPPELEISDLASGKYSKLLDMIDIAGYRSISHEQLPELSRLATGGPLMPGQTALVGEKGPELLIPHGSGFHVIPNNMLRGLAKGTGFTDFPDSTTGYNFSAGAGSSYEGILDIIIRESLAGVLNDELFDELYGPDSYAKGTGVGAARRSRSNTPITVNTPQLGEGGGFIPPEPPIGPRLLNSGPYVPFGEFSFENDLRQIGMDFSDALADVIDVGFENIIKETIRGKDRYFKSDGNLKQSTADFLDEALNRESAGPRGAESGKKVATVGFAPKLFGFMSNLVGKSPATSWADVMDKSSQKIRHFVTGIMIWEHAFRLLSQNSQVAGTNMGLFGRSIGFLTTVVMLPLLPAFMGLLNVTSLLFSAMLPLSMLLMGFMAKNPFAQLVFWIGLVTTGLALYLYKLKKAKEAEQAHYRYEQTPEGGWNVFKVTPQAEAIRRREHLMDERFAESNAAENPALLSSDQEAGTPPPAPMTGKKRRWLGMFAAGGYVPAEGLAHLHPGELVVPANVVSSIPKYADGGLFSGTGTFMDWFTSAASGFASFTGGAMGDVLSNPAVQGILTGMSVVGKTLGAVIAPIAAAGAGIAVVSQSMKGGYGLLASIFSRGTQAQVEATTGSARALRTPLTLILTQTTLVLAALIGIFAAISELKGPGQASMDFAKLAERFVADMLAKGLKFFEDLLAGFFRIFGSDFGAKLVEKLTAGAEFGGRLLEKLVGAGRNLVDDILKALLPEGGFLTKLIEKLTTGAASLWDNVMAKLFPAEGNLLTKILERLVPAEGGFIAKLLERLTGGGVGGILSKAGGLLGDAGGLMAKVFGIGESAPFYAKGLKNPIMYILGDLLGGIGAQALGGATAGEWTGQTGFRNDLNKQTAASQAAFWGEMALNLVPDLWPALSAYNLIGQYNYGQDKAQGAIPEGMDYGQYKDYALNKAIDEFDTIWSGFLTGLQSAWDGIVQGFSDVWTGMTEWFGTWVEGAKTAVSEFLENFASGIGSLFEWIKSSLISYIASSVPFGKELLGAAGIAVPALATGGVTTSDGLAYLHAAEVVAPLSTLSTITGSSQNTQVTTRENLVTNHNTFVIQREDDYQLFRRFMDMMEREQRRGTY